MNNFAVKNVINNLEKNKEMPYQETNDVSLKANQIIYTSVNNNFQKMVNNDLYIQKQLLNKSNYTEGPRLSSDDEVKNAEDGYKVWNPDLKDLTTERVSVLQKVVRNQKDTLTKTECVSNPHVNVIIEDASTGLLAGSDDGLYQVDRSFNASKKISDEVGNVNSSARMEDKNTLIATSNGLWNLSTSEEKFHKVVDGGGLYGIVSLSGQLVACSEDGIHIFGYSNGDLSNECRLPGITGEVKSVVAGESGLVAATDSGLYEGSKSYTIFQKGNAIEGVGGTIKNLFVFGGELFAIADDGLYVVADDKAQIVLKNNNINSVREIGGELLVAVGGSSSEKGVRRYNKERKTTEATGIGNAAYDIIKQGDYYLVGTTLGIEYSTDIDKSRALVKDSGAIDNFSTLGDIVYASDGTQVLKTAVRDTTYELHTKLGDVVDAIRTREGVFIATKDGIYDQSLKLVYTFSEGITRCRFVNIAHSSLDGIYALTNKGVLYCGDTVEKKCETTDMMDVKSTGQYTIKLGTDGILQYTVQVSKNFWDESVDWRPLGEGVSQIETIGDTAYFLKDGTIYRQEPDSKSFIDLMYGVSGRSLNTFELDEYDSESISLLSDVLAYYHDGTTTYGITSGDSEGSYKSVEMKTLTGSGFSDQLLKSYSNRSSTPFANHTVPRMPSIANGIKLRNLTNFNEIVRIQDGKIRSMALSSTNILDGTVMTTTDFSHAESHDGLFQYEDDSRSRKFQDDNYTFFTTNGATHSLKYTRPRKVNAQYADIGFYVKNSVLLPTPPQTSGMYLVRFDPQILTYGTDSVGVLSSNQDSLKLQVTNKTLYSGSQYYNTYQDRNWTITHGTLNGEAVSAYTKGVYHLLRDGIFKTYFTDLVTIGDSGVPKDQYCYFSSFFYEGCVLTATDLSVAYQAPKLVCPKPYLNLSVEYKLMQNKDAGFTYLCVPSKGQLYYQTTQLTSIGTSWTESDISGFADFEVCEGYGYEVDMDGDVWEYGHLDSHIISRFPLNYHVMGIDPGIVTRLATFYPNHHPVVIAYGKSEIFYIEPTVSYKSGIRLVVDGTESLLPSGAEISRIYSFPVCDEERICITDDKDNIYVVRYDNVDSKLHVEKRTQLVSQSGMQQCFPIDDSRYAYLGPEFDITTTNRMVYVNSFKIDYSDSNLSTLVKTSGNIVANIIDNSLYVASGRFLRRKEIDGKTPFFEQTEALDDWDDYDTLWDSEEEYQFDSDIKCFLTKYVNRGEAVSKCLLILTEGDSLYISEYDSHKKVSSVPTTYGVDFKEKVAGLTINSMAVVNENLVLNTDSGMYNVDIDYDSIKIVKSDKTELTNVTKLTKLADAGSSRELLAVVQDSKTGLVAFFGDDEDLSDFSGLRGKTITGIHEGNDTYYVFGETGVSSINDISSDVEQYEERLSGTHVDLLVDKGDYLIADSVKSFQDVYFYRMSDPVNIGIKPDEIYQYDSSNIYVRTADGLYQFDGDTVSRSQYNGFDVVDEFQKFKVVKTDAGMYFDNREVQQTEYTDNSDCYYDGYLANNGNKIHKYQVGHTYYMQLKVRSSKGQFKLLNVDGMILVACSDGWYRYHDGRLEKLVDCSFENGRAPYSSYMGKINTFTSKAETSHIFVLNGRDVYRFNPEDDSWTQIFQNGDVIDDIYTETEYKYLIGTHSDGLWYTYYAYDMVDRIKSPKKTEMVDEVGEIYRLSIENHIREYHDSKESVVSYLNDNILTPDLGNVTSEWQKSTRTSDGFVVVENDIVESFKTSSPQNPITVEVSNDYTDDEFYEIGGVTFIYRGWVSGQKEIYVNIPTTHTYYKPHLSGLAYCRNFDENVTHKNTGLPSSGGVHDASTTVKITIKRKEFDNLRNVQDAVIDGQSLPLKIYKDDTYDCGGSEQHFHSAIKKSVFLKKVHEPDSIVLYFRCYGTDEQALKLIGF